MKIPLNVDINLELRIGGNEKPSWKIDTNIDKQEYSYMRDKSEEPNWNAKVVSIDYKKGGVRINQMRTRRQKDSFL